MVAGRDLELSRCGRHHRGTAASLVAGILAWQPPCLSCSQVQVQVQAQVQVRQRRQFT